jgi:hypothetical protein
MADVSFGFGRLLAAASLVLDQPFVKPVRRKAFNLMKAARLSAWRPATQEWSK